MNQLQQQISTDFNKGWNLVRDQGVRGSNPLSSTIYFQADARLLHPEKSSAASCASLSNPRQIVFFGFHVPVLLVLDRAERRRLYIVWIGDR